MQRIVDQYQPRGQLPISPFHFLCVMPYGGRVHLLSTSPSIIGTQACSPIY